MDVVGDGEDDGAGEVKEEVMGTLQAKGSLDFLTQDVELSGTTLVDDRNGFNELSRLAMLWTVWHH